MLEFVDSSEGFLGIEEEVEYHRAQAIVIPFGLEKTVTYKGGTANGPAAMISASHQLELFDEHFWCEPCEHIGIKTLRSPKIRGCCEKALAQLEEIVQIVVDEGKFPFVFGGEHTITAGSIKPLLNRYPDLAIVHFDAHADLRESYDGEHYSHAAALRRCLDHPSVELYSFGIRSISSGEIDFLDDNEDRINIFWAEDKSSWSLDSACKSLEGRPVYLTFDLDAFDTSLMPATGTPEPGGLFWDDAINVISRISQVSRIVAADINELAPAPGFHGADFLAAKLAYKIMSYAFLSCSAKK